YFRCRCSGLQPRDLLCPLLTSDRASEDLAIFVAQRHAVRSPRVLRTHLHAYARRIYGTAFRTRIGLCIFLPAHPAVTPLIRFLFVAPALCFRLPSDLQSPGEPLPSANTSPRRACGGLSTPGECGLPGAQNKEPAYLAGFFFRFGSGFFFAFFGSGGVLSIRRKTSFGSGRSEFVSRAGFFSGFDVMNNYPVFIVGVDDHQSHYALNIPVRG